MKSFKPAPWVLPQPVVVIGTYNEDGTPNAMNAAWVGQWDAHEVVISLGSHATTDNLKRCADLTLAFATKNTMVAADYVGLQSGRKVADKVARTGWTAVKGQEVNAPVFQEFPLTLECRVKRTMDESETGMFVIAEIVNIQADEACLAADGKPNVEAMQLITFDPMHMGYIQLGQRVGNAFTDGKALV